MLEQMDSPESSWPGPGFMEPMFPSAPTPAPTPSSMPMEESRSSSRPKPKKKKKAAKKNIKKAQKAWREMSPQEHARAQPEGREREKPGITGEGNYYHIEVRPKDEFRTFRTQDGGKAGHAQRVDGQRESGFWDTQKWLINKEDAHLEGDRLVADTEDKSQTTSWFFFDDCIHREQG